MMWWRCAGAGAVLLAFSGCKAHGSPISPSASVGEAGEDPSAVVADPLSGAEGGASEAEVVKIAALENVTPVCSAPEWPPKDPTKAAEERQGVIRLGYLRKGDIVEAKAQRV